MPTSRKSSFLLVLTLLAFACFIYRGPLTWWQTNGLDFAPLYAASRTYLHGQNPYDIHQVNQTWHSASSDPISQSTNLLNRDSQVLLYPPTMLAALAPLAALDWSAAKPLLLALNFIMFALGIYGIAKFHSLTPRNPLLSVLLILAFCFLPIHTSFRHGQTSILILGILGSALATRSSFPTLSSILFLLAALFKPQLGIPFLLYELFHAKNPQRLIILLLGIALSLASLIPLWINHIPWYTDWSANLHAFTHSGPGDPTSSNPMRHQMLNLQPALHLYLDHRQIVTALSLTIVTLIALLGYLRNKSADPFTRDHAMINLITVLTLLWTYHRYYDAVILLIPLTWALLLLARRQYALSISIFVLSLPILTNSATVLNYLASHNTLPATLTESPAFTTFLTLHTPLSLLALALLLAVASVRRPQPLAA